MKEYKFKSSFSAQIKPLVSREFDKYLALASDINFKKYLPKDINFDEKIDFLGFAGEAFIANRLNLNDDGVSTEDAIRLANLFPLSFVDVEHNRDKICGVITNASYTEFGTSKELTLEEVKKTKSPFSVVVGGIIWRIPNPKFAEAVEASSDPNSEQYNKFFLSWEVLFSEAKLIVMDKDKSNFEDGQIISEANEISKLESKLKAFGGTGYTEDGKRIGRVIVDDCIPTAVGIVESPAAKVQPISIGSETEIIKIGIKSSVSSTYNCPSCDSPMDMEDEMEDDEEYICGKCNKTHAGKTWKKGIDVENKEESKSNNSEISNSQLEILAVKNDTDNKNITKNNDKLNKIMILKSYKDLTDEHLKEAKASDITSIFDAEIEKISKQYSEEKSKLDNSIKDSEAKAKELEDKYTKANEELAKVREDLNKLIEANETREKEEIFNSRMTYFEGEFELDEKSRNAVANRIKNLSEDAYKQEKEDLEVLLAAKKKEKMPAGHTGKADCSCAMCTDKTKTKESKASVEIKEEITSEAVEKAIEDGEKAKAAVAATVAPTFTLQDKFNKAFDKSNWEIKSRK